MKNLRIKQIDYRLWKVIRENKNQIVKFEFFDISNSIWQQALFFALSLSSFIYKLK